MESSISLYIIEVVFRSLNQLLTLSKSKVMIMHGFLLVMILKTLLERLFGIMMVNFRPILNKVSHIN